MSFKLLRGLVSTNKRRLREGEYDLDLSYITDSIVAMVIILPLTADLHVDMLATFYQQHMVECEN